MQTRRAFFGVMAGAVAAPILCRFASLMPIRVLMPDLYAYAITWRDSLGETHLTTWLGELDHAAPHAPRLLRQSKAYLVPPGEDMADLVDVIDARVAVGGLVPDLIQGADVVPNDRGVVVIRPNGTNWEAPPRARPRFVALPNYAAGPGWEHSGDNVVNRLTYG